MRNLSLIQKVLTDGNPAAVKRTIKHLNGGAMPNKFKPHQGKRECARRRKRMGAED